MSSTDREWILKTCAQRVGTTIDNKYRLDQFLGAGTSGAVYRATNVWAGREVAVKVFHYEGENRETALQRFIREAQVANRVRRDGRVHPNVVDSLDVGRDGESGRIFTVQEFLHGVTLLEHLRAQPEPLSVPDAASILLPVIDAISVAHEAGVVHRDLKPENIFLEIQGEEMVPKVLDFGIAQLSDARLTAATDIMGTPTYMAPECFMDARRVGPPADVWALGVIFYEMVSGKAPFGQTATTLLGMMTEIATKEPPSLAERGIMAPPAWGVIRRCIERDLEKRIPTGRALLEALDEVIVRV
ncbi:MAG: serine/threonine-protein kinase [Polyangiales bacterium]